jgi:anthranilate phosphoribosyltransferase
MNDRLEHMIAGRDLSQPDAGALLRSLAAGEVDPALAGALLTALRIKGEAASEIRGFALAMRELALRPALPAGRDPESPRFTVALAGSLLVTARQPDSLPATVGR